MVGSQPLAAHNLTSLHARDRCSRWDMQHMSTGPTVLRTAMIFAARRVGRTGRLLSRFVMSSLFAELLTVAAFTTIDL